MKSGSLKDIAAQNKKLFTYEKQIDKNIKAAWYENNIILVKIRDEGLYSEKYGTYENYLSERWGYDKSTGYRLIGSVELCQKLELKMSPIGDKKAPLSVRELPANEAQVRPLLTGLKTDSERAKVWANVVEASKSEDRKITATYVQEKVDEFIASGEIAEEIDFDELKRKQEEVIDAKKAAAQKPKISVEPEKAIEQEHTEADQNALLMEIIETQETLIKELQSENLSLVKIHEANEPLIQALEELKRTKAISKGFEDRMQGLQNERAHLMTEVKRLQSKINRLEKANAQS